MNLKKYLFTVFAILFAVVLVGCTAKEPEPPQPVELPEEGAAAVMAYLVEEKEIEGASIVNAYEYKAGLAEGVERWCVVFEPAVPVTYAGLDGDFMLDVVYLTHSDDDWEVLFLVHKTPPVPLFCTDGDD